MVPPRKEQKSQPHNDLREPSSYEGPENAKEVRRENASPRKSPPPTKDGQTRGKDQIGHEMTTEHAQARGRDQTAREMGGQRKK